MSHDTFIKQPKSAIYFIAACALFIWARASFSQNISTTELSPGVAASLAPFASADGNTLHPAWQLTGLPKNKAPRTEFKPVTLDGTAALQLRTQASYGVLTHPWHGPAPEFLSWRWRLAQPLAAADIHTKAGDDAALKVCVMFDQPLADIPFFQRAALMLASTAIAVGADSDNTQGSSLGYLAQLRWLP